MGNRLLKLFRIPIFFLSECKYRKYKLSSEPSSIHYYSTHLNRHTLSWIHHSSKNPKSFRKNWFSDCYTGLIWANSVNISCRAKILKKKITRALHPFAANWLSNRLVKLINGYLNSDGNYVQKYLWVGSLKTIYCLLDITIQVEMRVDQARGAAYKQTFIDYAYEKRKYWKRRFSHIFFFYTHIYV